MCIVLIVSAPFHCSQEPIACPCLNQNNPFYVLTSNFFEISSNIILPSNTCVFPAVCFLQVSPPKHYILPSSSHTCHMPSPSHSPLFDHLNNILWGIQIMKLLIMKCPPVSSPFRSRCLPQHPVLKLHWPTIRHSVLETKCQILIKRQAKL
jgi:hypothetical protein